MRWRQLVASGGYRGLPARCVIDVGGVGGRLRT
jgi:hypothetical protein